MNEKDIEKKVLSDEDLEGVSGGTQAQPLLFRGEAPKAASAVQKGKADKAKNLVYKEEKKDFDGKLLSGGFDGPTYC